MAKQKYYYEIGVLPTDDIEDGYSLFVALDTPLIGDDFDKLEYLRDNGYITSQDAKDGVYVNVATKEQYEWSVA